MTCSSNRDIETWSTAKTICIMPSNLELKLKLVAVLTQDQMQLYRCHLSQVLTDICHYRTILSPVTAYHLLILNVI